MRCQRRGTRPPPDSPYSRSMDENWPLFAARVSGRAPTEHEARLLDASRRLWDTAVSFTKNKLAEISEPEADAHALTTQLWEEVLLSVLGTMDKLGATRIADLDAYLFAIFRNRLNRHLAAQRKRRRIVESMPSLEDLAKLDQALDVSWVRRLDSEILLRQGLARMDEVFRATAWWRTQGYSWNEVGRMLGLTKEQARKRFEYGLRKLRKLLLGEP